MNEKLHEHLDALTRILAAAGDKGFPLRTVVETLSMELRDKTGAEGEPLAEETVRFALDEWLAVKIIDYDEKSDLVWFLKNPSEEEAKRYRELSEVQQTLLRMLYECNDERKVGAMKRVEAIRKLNEMGFDVDDLPVIPGIVCEVGIPEEDGLHRWVYIIPQYEFSEEFKALEQESLEKARRIDERMMRETD